MKMLVLLVMKSKTKSVLLLSLLISGLLLEIQTCNRCLALDSPKQRLTAQAPGGSTDNLLKPPIAPPPTDGASPPLDLKDPFASADSGSSVSMAPLRLNSRIQISSFLPLRPEGSFDQMISLKEALDYAMENNLPIRISRETYAYQKYQFLSSLANALPNLGASYTLTKSKVLPSTSSLSRVFTPRISYPVFQGGSVFYGALSQYYREKGWKEALHSSVNESLLDVYQKYSNLVLNRALLKIRAKSLEVSREQYVLNQRLFRAGTGTKFAILQSRTQLAADQEALLQQQVLVRQSSLALAYSLNAPMAMNFIPSEDNISEQQLLQKATNIDRLIETALRYRPDLKQYELFKLAAARNVQVAASALYPNASFFTLYSYSNTTVNTPQAPLKNLTSTSSSSLGSTAGAGVFGGLFNTFEGGFALTYSLPGFGLVGAANVAGAQVLNKQALMQANQELQLVMQQVRADYISWLSAKQQIEATVYGAASAGEALRLAEIRLLNGVGTNLELIQAQRDYISALSSEAQAIINSNIAQALIQRDLGVISVDSLTKGYVVGSVPSNQDSRGAKP